MVRSYSAHTTEDARNSHVFQWKHSYLQDCLFNRFAHSGISPGPAHPRGIVADTSAHSGALDAMCTHEQACPNQEFADAATEMDACSTYTFGGSTAGGALQYLQSEVTPLWRMDGEADFASFELAGMT